MCALFFVIVGGSLSLYVNIRETLSIGPYKDIVAEVWGACFRFGWFSKSYLDPPYYLKRRSLCFLILIYWSRYNIKDLWIQLSNLILFIMSLVYWYSNWQIYCVDFVSKSLGVWKSKVVRPISGIKFVPNSGIH